LRRKEVAADKDLISNTTERIDAVWIGGPWIQEVRDLAHEAPSA
jgi:hypothetical protein